MRGLLYLRKILQVGLGALVLPGQIAVAGADHTFDSDGHLQDKQLQDDYKSLIEDFAVAATKLSQ